MGQYQGPRIIRRSVDCSVHTSDVTKRVKSVKRIMETGTVLFLSLISLWALRGLLSGNSTTTLLKKFPELWLPRYRNGDLGGAAHWIRTMPEIFVTAPGSPFVVRNHDRLQYS